MSRSVVVTDQQALDAAEALMQGPGGFGQLDQDHLPRLGHGVAYHLDADQLRRSPGAKVRVPPVGT